MDIQTQIQSVKDRIKNAEVELREAKRILVEITGEEDRPSFRSVDVSDVIRTQNFRNDGKVIEGVFDGESMIGPDNKRYPVPPNYASKSKLISGDILKLTIADNGAFIYKQIGPVERKQVIGTLKRVGSDYIVILEEGEFRVLTASVTYFKALPGDTITLIIPEGAKYGWGAIENILPEPLVNVQGGDNSTKEPEDFEIPKMLFKSRG